MALVNEKLFYLARSEMRQKKKKRYIENNMNTQARVNRSTYQKTADSYQVFNYHRDELLNDNGQLDMKNHSTT